MGVRKNNLSVWARMIENDVLQWQLADMIGVSDSTMARIFRYEWTDSTKEKVCALLSGEKIDIVSLREELLAYTHRSKKRNKNKADFIIKTEEARINKILDEVEDREFKKHLEREGWL